MPRNPCTLLVPVLLSAALGLRAQVPPPSPPAPSSEARPAAASPVQGTASDGRLFRILDRVTREVDGLVMFRGRIPSALSVGKSASGDLSLCANCGAGAAKAASKEPAAGAPGPKKDAVETTGAGGDLLLLDLKGMYDLRLEDGAFIFYNDDGYDADGREYAAYPTAGPDTGLSRMGSLLFLSNRAGASGCPFKVALRSWGTTYLAPIAGCDQAPAKAIEADAGPEGPRELTRDHMMKTTEWAGRYKMALSYRDGAAECPLTSALTVLAAGKEDFLAVFDLRKLESAQSSYFWMTRSPRLTVRLDRNTVAVEGSGEGAAAYEPATFVEYPYLVVLGSYAKVRLSPAGGGPETVLTLGFCDECPPS